MFAIDLRALRQRIRPQVLVMIGITVPLIFLDAVCYYSSGSHHGHCHYHSGYDHCHSGGYDSHVHAEGHVVFLVTDAPAREISSFYLTVTEIVLLGQDVEPQAVYRSNKGWRVDLLSLRGEDGRQLHDLIVAGAPLPVGVYDTLRLQVRDPAVTLPSGQLIGAERIDMAGGGNLELALQDPLSMGPDDRAFVVLDFDVEHSITPPEDADAFWQVAPVVLVEVLRSHVRRRITAPLNVAGWITETDDDSREVLIELEGARGVLRVSLDEEALVGGSSAAFGSRPAISVGDRVTVTGRLDDLGRLVADSLLRGETVRLRGVLLDVPLYHEEKATSRFVVEPVPGQSLTGTIELLAEESTVLTRGRSRAAGLEELLPGDEVAVIGALSRLGGGDAIRVARLDVRPGRPSLSLPDAGALADQEQSLEGVVHRVNGERRTLTVKASGQHMRLHVPVEAPIVYRVITDDTLWQTSLELRDLRAGTELEIRRGTTGLRIFITR